MQHATGNWGFVTGAQNEGPLIMLFDCGVYFQPGAGSWLGRIAHYGAWVMGDIHVHMG